MYVENQRLSAQTHKRQLLLSLSVWLLSEIFTLVHSYYRIYGLVKGIIHCFYNMINQWSDNLQSLIQVKCEDDGGSQAGARLMTFLP